MAEVKSTKLPVISLGKAAAEWGTENERMEES